MIQCALHVLWQNILSLRALHVCALRLLPHFTHRCRIRVKISDLLLYTSTPSHDSVHRVQDLMYEGFGGFLQMIHAWALHKYKPFCTMAGDRPAPSPPRGQGCGARPWPVHEGQEPR